MKKLIRWLKLFIFFASGEAYEMTDEEIQEHLDKINNNNIQPKTTILPKQH